MISTDPDGWSKIRNACKETKPTYELRVLYNQLAIRIDEGLLSGLNFIGNFSVSNFNKLSHVMNQAQKTIKSLEEGVFPVVK